MNDELKTFFKEKKISLCKVSKEIGYTYSHVWHILNNKKKGGKHFYTILNAYVEKIKNENNK